MFSKSIGIDLGTANVLVYVRGKGIVLTEPSVVAVSTSDNKLLAIGAEARAMLGRSPDSITVSRPMRDGVIADYLITQAMLEHFIKKVCGRFRLFRPEVMVGIPAGVTSVERRAVHDAALQAGAKVCFLIEEPRAAAIGASVPIHLPSGNMVVDMGGGTTEAAVLALNDIVVARSVRVGGNKMDDAIANYIRRKYGLMVGERTAEEIKMKIGSALPLEPEVSLEIRGRDQVTGLPKNITINSAEVRDAISETLAAMVAAIKSVLEETPPELASDVMDKGMVLTGGGALLRNIDRLFAAETGVACYVAENPMDCVATGAGVALEHIDMLKRTLPTAD
ncbi:MAG: rod shape-determining protein [Chloroflexi bacterium]|nr:rod shape-determining protein [Chloroflexota bacterium]MCL5107654.1 rod shape-determining protein [Chloroflexota bacterium]